MSIRKPNTVITMVPDRCYDRRVEETNATPQTS